MGDLFLIQAMHLYVLLNVPAVIFFEGLERHPQCNVLDVNKTRTPESVKLCCPDCRVNDSVLSASAWRSPASRPLRCRSMHPSMLCMAGEYNVNQKGRVRFALSKVTAYLIVSRKWVCCNPTCTRIMKKHEVDPSKISKLFK